LAAKDIVTDKMLAYWGHFGSWELQAVRGADAVRYAAGLRSSEPTQAVGPEVVRVLWDGRENYVSIEASPTRPLCAPNEWQTELTRGFDEESDELLSFIEEYLVQRLGA
jgi:hypothetical protein